ncbi:serine/threonine-protein kinase [Candidatus Uabimicrobium amorphum]|uniref:Protein kinase n=2 Tax=Uabimicrobium amorphum TaxID=2596890 RepID=A0A5S9ITL2_UABAM|nr:protein kinase [Candidatus Uabimicrobium amorphum]
MHSSYFEKKCDCEHTIEIEMSQNTDFLCINCKVCGGNYLFKISQYIVNSMLGSGGSGQVYLATDHNGKQVALKTLAHPTQANLKHFERECSMQQKLQHKNIIQLLDQGNHGDLYYLVMEYFPGQTFDEIITERGYLTPREAIKIILSVLSGLAYADKLNMVHRDIKPENIYITDDGQVKILDMGLAKIVDETYGLTDAEAIKGSPYFMSPEQLAATKTADIRADIYSVGATLYNALCGVEPFSGHKTILQVAIAKKENKYQSLKDYDIEISPELIRIVEKSMALIDSRYQNPQEMMQDLYDLYKNL